MTEIGAIFADYLRPRWVVGLNKIGIPTLKGVESWLINGAYSWLPSPSGSLLLDTSNVSNTLAEAFASEISRFSCATYESLIDSTPRNQGDQSLGWTLIRHYYASFYAAHALLRISGTAIIMMSSQTASALNRVGGQYLGLSPNITAGLHILQVDRTNSNRLVLQKIGGGSGGSHEEMWKVFLVLLRDLEQNIVLAQGRDPSALATVQALTALRAHLCRQGKDNGAWPSMVRNNVNYRHDYGVWYPYKLTAKAGSQLLLRMAKWVPHAEEGYEIGSTEDELACFVDVCNVLTQLLTASLSDIARRSTKSKSGFVDRLPFKLLRLRNLLA